MLYPIELQGQFDNANGLFIADYLEVAGLRESSYNLLARTLSPER